jgi:hypothetical protein
MVPRGESGMEGSRSWLTIPDDVEGEGRGGRARRESHRHRCDLCCDDFDADGDGGGDRGVMGASRRADDDHSYVELIPATPSTVMRKGSGDSGGGGVVVGAGTGYGRGPEDDGHSYVELLPASPVSRTDVERGERTPPPPPGIVDEERGGHRGLDNDWPRTDPVFCAVR